MSGEGIVFFYSKSSPFSQHHPSEFEVDGVRYCCAEQYMMAAKARMFEDTASLAAIMGTTDPVAMKREGRRVTPFNKERWDAASEDVVYQASVSKFGQCPSLRKALMATGSALLVEASPRDRIWGIGLSESRARKMRPQDWPGENRLGKALMRARATLRAEAG
eukprot:CAMPEP_0196780738 /NCGR_PEP_ID=MMETSP1104-20130614/8470_1 /TAXON_ID=33652 /ORGANISM="Cafeteria sp., Strain Caron Lab Isolate" /LENGTH=162 /DNA_ID=CAMNT_0042150953 /DNA_START=17 /DNA_END=502 /DNA_ORIENTATION=-